MEPKPRPRPFKPNRCAGYYRAADQDQDRDKNKDAQEAVTVAQAVRRGANSKTT